MNLVHLCKLSTVLVMFTSFSLAQTLEIDPNVPPSLQKVHVPTVSRETVDNVTSQKKLTTLNTSTTPFNFEDVLLIASDSPQFDMFVAQSVSKEVKPSVEKILPYSVVIQNTGTNPIVGFSVTWTMTSPSGEVFKLHRTVFDLYNLEPVVPAGNFIMFTPSEHLGVSNLSRSNPLSSGIVGQVDDAALELQSQSSVVISLESVLFLNGTSLGPDRFHSIPKLKRMIQAEFDLYNELDRSGITRDSLNNLQRLSQEEHSNNDKVDPYSYHHYRVQAARELIAVMQAQDVTGVITLISSRLQSKPYKKFLLN